jgi:hypothetical protein
MKDGFKAFFFILHPSSFIRYPAVYLSGYPIESGKLRRMTKKIGLAG